MKRNSNDDSKMNKMKKTFSRQKSINPNLVTIKDPNIMVSQNEIKPKKNFKEDIIRKNNKNNTKIKNENINNKNIVVITNESSYLVLESFLNEHQIKYTSIFILYLSEIWRELSLYSTDYNEGIIPFAFSRFFPLAGLISKRLFDVLDINKDGFLSPKEFIQGLFTIFCEDICSLIEFIFLFYDFDYDGYITSEDIHAIMSYIPVINSFSDMIDIEEEIQNTLEEIFVDDKKKLNLNEFIDLIINKERYEIFIPIISFFFEQKPFSNQEIEFFYKNIINNNNNNNKKQNYKIEGKIKLKVEKDENISKAFEDKIMFAFDKNSYDDLNNDNEKEYEEEKEKEKEKEYEEQKEIEFEKEKENENENIKTKINKKKSLYGIKKVNFGNNITNNNPSNNLNNDNKSIDSYGDNINDNKKDNDSSYEIPNNISVKVIENENENENEQDENNTNTNNNNINKTTNINNNNILDSLNNSLNKISNLKKQESNTSSNLPKEKFKTFSRQNSVGDIKRIKKKVISRFANKEDSIEKYDINIEIENILNNKNLKEKAKEQYKTRTQSMRNIKYKRDNLKDLVSKSKGFKHLQKSIPSLINNTKILSKYSSKNMIKYEQDILNQYKKGSIIQSLCKSKIKYDNNENYTSERKITEDSYEIERNEANEFVGIKLVNKDNDNKQNDENKEINKNNKSEFQIKEKVKYESYLYKITPNSKKLKKLYFKLYNKNLYYYKNENSPIHKGMHNLCHYFLELSEDNENDSEESSILVEKNNSYKEDDDSFIDSEQNNKSDKTTSEYNSEIIIKKINSIDYYCFILISQKGKIQWYLTPDREIYNKWVESLKTTMDYKDILDQYEFKEVVGKGKFSIVYCAYDKINKRKVAIKRIDKTILKLSELELIKTEIDILRICQHPYVIGLYDVIETYSCMDIILEYCQIGNLYNFLVKKKFQLTEQEIVTYIHKISKAVYSMHNLGIIHRDLKLSNIAMADGTEGDIRILDFGLSKIIGPGETCSESYGTPGYAAPEVINEESYRFKADVWSIGAISYFMCSSKLPFDYMTKGLNKTNIILNTLNDELKFNDDCWKKYSKEAIKFIKACMNKNTEKRLTIKQVLEHEWIKKYFYREVRNRESCSNFPYFSNSGKNVNKKIVSQKSYQKKLSSLGTTYRLYADISD